MYNLLLDTQFKYGSWKFINCSYKNGYLKSTSKVFGIEQRLTLSDLYKLYARVNYKVFNNFIIDVKIGLQYNDILEISRKTPKVNKLQNISLVNNIKDTNIKFCVIFESTEDKNEVFIEKPILYNLSNSHRSTWLKAILDKTINYLDGYSYKNEYCVSELKTYTPMLLNLTPEKAKIGSIITISNTTKLDIRAKFIDNNIYLIKLNIEEINRYGDTYFKYGVLKSKRYKNQVYLIFKYNFNTSLDLIFEPNEAWPYKINLKNILLINISNLNLQKEDIVELPFTEELHENS